MNQKVKLIVLPEYTLSGWIMLIALCISFVGSLVFAWSLFVTHNAQMRDAALWVMLVSVVLGIIIPEIIKKGLVRFLLPENRPRCWVALVLNVYTMAVYFGYELFPPLHIGVPNWLALCFAITFWASWVILFIIMLLTSLEKRAALKAEQEKQA